MYGNGPALTTRGEHLGVGVRGDWDYRLRRIKRARRNAAGPPSRDASVKKALRLCGGDEAAASGDDDAEEQEHGWRREEGKEGADGGPQEGKGGKGWATSL